MYDFEESRETSATVEHLWAVYTDVAGWPRWNDAVDSAELTGPFESGAGGTVTVHMGVSQSVPFRLENVDPMKRFDVVWTVGPLVTTTMTHTFEPTAGGARFKHAYHTGGIFAPFAFLQATAAHSRVHGAMERVAALAEARAAKR